MNVGVSIMMLTSMTFIFLYFWNALWKKKKKEKDMQVLYGPSMFLLYMHYMQNTVKKMKKIRLNGI